MGKQTKGIVTKTYGEFALVRPTAHTGCDSSYCCQGDGVKKVILEMMNEINASVGDEVIFEAKEGGMIKAAFILFVLPFVMVFIGAAGGYKASEVLLINTTVGAIAGSILLFASSIVIIKLYDKSASKNPKLLPVIIKKI